MIGKFKIFIFEKKRWSYWMFQLFNIIVAVVIGFVLGFIGAILGIGTALSDPVSLIYALAVLIPGIAVAIRRMHDTGRSGWWILFPFVNLVLLCLDSQPSDNEYGPTLK